MTTDVDAARAALGAEAGDYIEDDPAAWEAFLDGARRYFVENLPQLREQFGDEGIGIAAGAMLSYLADEHGVYLGRAEAGTLDWLTLAFRKAELDWPERPELAYAGLRTAIRARLAGSER